MDKKTFARMEARAAILKALAHPTRLFIVEELSHGEKCVCELTEMVGSDISTLSKHLAILKNAGIIKDEKRGLRVWYSLSCPCVFGFLECAEAVLKENIAKQTELVG